MSDLLEVGSAVLCTWVLSLRVLFLPRELLVRFRLLAVRGFFLLTSSSSETRYMGSSLLSTVTRSI